jgi:hypothetical protein
MAQVRGCAGLIVLLFLLGCGSGSENYLKITPGNWVFAGTSSAFTDTYVYIGGNLMQSGRQVSATMHVDSVDCFDLLTDVEFSGEMNGSSVTMTSNTISGQVITVTLSGTESALTGNYNISGGCANGDHGTVAAVNVPAITGAWSGTITRSDNSTFTTAGTLTEGPADVHGLFTLSGSLSFTGSSCFSSGNVDAGSFIAGDLVYVALTPNTGGVVEFAAYLDDASTGKSMQGVYQVTGGACPGESGNIAISRP